MLSFLFSNTKPVNEPRLINGTFWATTSSNLQQKHLRFILKWNRVEPNLFAHLFLPVLERRFAELGIKDHEEIKKEECLTELLRIPMHDMSNAWVVAHKREKFDSSMARIFGDEGNESLKEDDEDEPRSAILSRKQQIEDDYHFAQTCCAILNNDDDHLLRTLKNGTIEISRPNLCFGTTLLKVALKHSKIRTLRLVLELGQLAGDEKVYELLRMAMLRDQDNKEAISLLIYVLIASKDNWDLAPKDSIHFIFSKAILEDHLPIFDCVLEWVHSNWHSESVKWVLYQGSLEALYAGNLVILDRLCTELTGLYESRRIQHVLHAALRLEQCDVTILTLLMKYGASIDENHPESKKRPPSPLRPTAEPGQEGQVEALLRAGANPRNRIRETWAGRGCGALMRAINRVFR